jgi:hypothetical protein
MMAEGRKKGIGRDRRDALGRLLRSKDRLPRFDPADLSTQAMAHRSVVGKAKDLKDLMEKLMGDPTNEQLADEGIAMIDGILEILPIVEVSIS